MTKDERLTSYKYSVLQYAYKNKTLPVPADSITYPEPVSMSGKLDLKSLAIWD